MIGRALRAAAAALLLLGPAHAQQLVDARIDAVIADALARRQIPGASVAVLRAGALVHSKGYGTADLQTNAAATATTVYAIGSISKMFTAAAIMKLVEADRVRLDDPVAAHVSTFRSHARSVRVEHLLRQTSGIREFLTLREFGVMNEDPRRGIDELMALVERQPLGFAPGSRWSYSNSNYHLLARIVENVDGRPYEEALARWFFRPLGLSSLHHCKQQPVPPKDARGTSLRDGRRVEAPQENMNLARGDGGLCAHAEDLVRWIRSLARGEAIAPESYRRMTTARTLPDGNTPPYGFGISLLSLDGRQRVAHSGEIGGYSAQLAYYPDDDLAIAVLTNRAGVAVAAIEAAIARAVLGLPQPGMLDLAVPPEIRKRALGRWDIGIGEFPVRIVADGDRLRLEMPPPGVTDSLAYQGDGVFAAHGEPDAHRVRIERVGERDQLVLQMGGVLWYGRRGP